MNIPRHPRVPGRRGFALIDVMSPCVTFNRDNTAQFFRQRVSKLEDMEHDAGDWKEACEKAMVWDDNIYIGVFYQVKGTPSLDEAEPVLDQGGPMAHRELGLNVAQVVDPIEKR